MKTAYASAIALALAALTAGQTFAADNTVGKTREQVKAELAQAIRAGQTIANINTDQTFADMFPGNFPAQKVDAGLTRAEVQAELARAVRNGEPIANIKTGQTYAELFPASYPSRNVAAGKTRAAVKEELTQALRNVDVMTNHGIN